MLTAKYKVSLGACFFFAWVDVRFGGQRETRNDEVCPEVRPMPL